MFELSINGQKVSVDVDDDTPLLWVVRDELGMTGTKFGCGIGMCGACTVHIDGVARRSCVTTVSQAVGVEITTIEGLSADASHPVQEAWRNLRVPQCGYCQSGQIMQAASLLAGNPNPSDSEIDSAMTGNLCRCMTYVRIRQAVREAVTAINEGAVQNG
ncbi:(2Fe-2S)-binding protein [Ketogulonicigenium vulgare]|uniref:Isoquinoline 1-oxidoreductase alpha subunit n=1 Tax=Ketogulonicigenium vulgare (strain WSH-001) TaxID=759362 RepID=F9Y765_KETVW|nr:(2Fe-2S)-binding protein [Ketogulonicigenium vulgare]ADO41263.1 Membrane-bound aldehyde dehydrogenase, small subunit [Ketogulonicigenium vulgare Y25]AEM42255.1 Isoquinoline 1-oxidoreductase alpha subunit [Ketogulonicigenium vulgare WSH-001]ALJ79874.1 (2Fe-2S)-binding protein [Ketogulonicigenium vulgare]ANW32778.1 (2Fe-2S)-binding protein [Ketogulonicigenium vulgare]AOZ53090.1 aldehyde dehydrogenase small subunit [Ketogulonicigenium vulgare]